MRMFLIAAAGAASALALAAPASAQYYPMPNGYAQGYNNHGHLRSLQVRIDRLQRRIEQLDRRNRISNREARRLYGQAQDVERRLYRASRNGLHPMEHGQIEQRLQQLEYRLMRDVNDGRGWDNRGQAYQGYGYPDRDRDGRDDRREDDGGWNRD